MIGAIIAAGVELVGTAMDLINRAVTAKTEDQQAILERLKKSTDELRYEMREIDKAIADNDAAADKRLSEADKADGT